MELRGGSDLTTSGVAQNDDVEEVNTSGTLSVIAGTGTAGAPTYGGAPTSSKLDVPTAVVVDADGDVDIADSTHNTVDQVEPAGGLTCSSADDVLKLL